jgi:iron-sulfur cluster assembly accessory protein
MLALRGVTRAMPDGTTTLPAFRVTDRAAAQVADIAAREGRPGAGLRLAVEAGGCSGFQYKFGLEDAPAPDDLVVGDGPGRVFVDPVSLDLLSGAELDWAEELIGAHFAIRNPQAVSACGCGTSFAVG